MVLFDRHSDALVDTHEHAVFALFFAQRGKQHATRVMR